MTVIQDKGLSNREEARVAMQVHVAEAEGYPSLWQMSRLQKAGDPVDWKPNVLPRIVAMGSWLLEFLKQEVI